MTCSVVLYLSLLASNSQFQQADGWDRVFAVTKGTTIRVSVTEAGRSTIAQGAFVDATLQTIEINDSGSQRTFSRDTVTRVEAARPRHPVKKGFYIGATGGLVQGLFALKGVHPIWSPFFIVGWGSIGALGGGVVSAVSETRFDPVFIRTSR